MAEQRKYEKIFSDYLRGMYVVQAQEQIIHQNPVIGLFPKQEVETKQITLLESEDFDKYKEKMPKGKGIAKGASARKFRGTLKTPKGFEMSTHEIEYTIAKSDMENPYYFLSDEVSAMAYILGLDIVETIYTTAKENAVTVSSGLNKDWDGASTTYDKILNDIVVLKKQLRSQGIAKIDNFLYGDGAITALAAKSQVEASRYDYDAAKEGFYVDDVMRISGANHMWGGQDFTDGEVIGFNYNYPAMKIFYKKSANPQAATAPAIPGFEEVAPAISMLMYDDEDTNLNDPLVTIKMGCTVGAVPIAKGNRMIRVADILG